MKRIQDIEKLSAADWERIGGDESIPVPADLSVRLPRRSAAVKWSVAASVAVLTGIGLTALLRTPEPEDTFSDPYLAYAAVEQALNKMSGNVQKVSDQVSRAEEKMDQLNYWK